MKEELEIKRLAHGMDGVGYAADGRVVFVQGALPDEVVTAHITQSKKRFMRAKVDTIQTPSTHRVTPACPVFDRCGGCQCWHIASAQEMIWKVHAAMETVTRLSGLKTLPDVVSHSGEMEGYRTKATLHCETVRGRRVLGFLAAGSKDVVSLPECRVLHPLVWRAYLILKDWPCWTRGRCQIETASDSTVVLTFIKSGLSDDAVELQCQALINAHELVAGVIWSHSRRRQHHVGQTDIMLPEVFGVVPESLREASVPGGLFRQSNSKMNTVLVSRIRSIVADIGQSFTQRPVVTELFAGAGNISFALADDVQALMAFEAPGPSVTAGARLADEAGTANVRFHAHDLMGDMLHGDVLNALRSSDLVVLDPPRDGARLVCESLREMSDGPTHMLYVSCDPGALGRDLRIVLNDGLWSVRAVECFDMFPRTSHVETLVWLVR